MATGILGLEAATLAPTTLLAMCGQEETRVPTHATLRLRGASTRHACTRATGLDLAEGRARDRERSERQAEADRREAGCCASERSERGTATRLAPHLTGQRSRHTEQWIPEIVLGFECGGRPGHRDACEAVGRWRGSYHDRTAPRARPSPVAAPSSNAAVAGRRLPSFREVMFPGRRLGFVVVAAERSIRSRTSTRRCPDLPAHYL
jgi:hypothetical protein